jgi:hypothetical protein
MIFTLIGKTTWGEVVRKRINVPRERPESNHDKILKKMLWEDE